MLENIKSKIKGNFIFSFLFYLIVISVFFAVFLPLSDYIGTFIPYILMHSSHRVIAFILFVPIALFISVGFALMTIGKNKN